MTRKLLLALFAITMVAVTSTSYADRYSRSRNDNPMRLIGYAGHAAGMVVEYSVMRPIHWVVSRPYLDVFFGTRPLPRERDTYFEYTHGNFKPSIAAEYHTPERERARAEERARKEAEKEEARQQRMKEKEMEEKQKEAAARAKAEAEEAAE